MIEPGLSVVARKGRLRVTMNRERLAGAKRGLATDVAARLEAANCLSPSEAHAFALDAATTVVPLAIEASNSLVYASGLAGYLDLRPGYRLRLVRPLLRAGAGPNASAISSVGGATMNSDGSLNVDARSSADLLGYETAWYEIERRGSGFAIRELTAESHLVNQSGEKPGKLNAPWDRLNPTAVYYRVLYLTRSSSQDRDALLLAESTHARIEAVTAAIAANPALCQSGSYRSTCVVLPRQAALTAHVQVSLNGSTVAVPVGSSLRGLLDAQAGEKPESLLRRLRILKPYRGALAGVEFDRLSPAILDLRLRGGESVSWQ